MNQLQRIWKENKILSLIFLLSLLGVFCFSYTRLDFTSDKRYTLTKVTKNTLAQVKDPLKITVYLQGDFPANFKDLQKETESLLQEFRNKNPQISYTFIDPIKNKISPAELKKMGLLPSVLQVKEDGGTTQKTIYPYAVIQYKDYGEVVRLMSNKEGISPEEQMRLSIEGLEYNFVNAIDHLTHDKLKSVGFVVNQKELNQIEEADFVRRIMHKYNFAPALPQDSVQNVLTPNDLPRLKKFDVLVVAKPRKEFKDSEKLVLDQYLMNGGKMMWLVSPINAEMDTLVRSNRIIAYPYKLNLDDLLFSYGVRVNSSLLKDLQRATPINIQVGSIEGNAQMQTLPWAYYPLGYPDVENVITKNINPVRFEFPSSIELLPKLQNSKEVKTTVLYNSSPYTQLQSVPSPISLEEAKTMQMSQENIKNYTAGSKPLAVLLEGTFNSAYKGRIESSGMAGFIEKSKPTKMLVVADGNIARNEVVRGNPIPLGMDPATGVTYGNADFLMNSIDYLVDDGGLMQLRNRTIQMRLLNNQEIILDRKYWQWINMLVPLIMLGLVALVCMLYKMKKFAK